MKLPATDVALEALVKYLKHNCGWDLTGYKHSTLERLRYRMRLIGINSEQEYLQYLQSHDNEQMALLDTVFVNVTSFFRDRNAWDYLANEIVPQIIASSQPDELIRVWSAGCATGQEIYSLLILFAEALGVESCLQRVQFYGTDIDEAALKQARLATYRYKEVAGIPSNLLEKYFELTEQGYVFDHKLRRSIVLGRHDLTQDAPISKINLLVCRNTLMYFNIETQINILVRFHFALKDNGFLFLGNKEIPSTNKEVFTSVSLKYKVFAKQLHLKLSDRPSLVSKLGKKQALNSTMDPIHFWQATYQSSPFAQLAVDFNGRLIVANDLANISFGLTLADRNRLFQELGLGKLLADCVASKTFYRQRHSVTLKQIAWSTSKDTQYFDIYIIPIFHPRKHLLGVNLTFYQCEQAQITTAKT